MGVSIASNKFKGIRCAVCTDTITAKLARMKSYCNSVALGGRIIGL